MLIARSTRSTREWTWPIRSPSAALRSGLLINGGAAISILAFMGKRLVFIDETWAKTNMTRLHGWAPKGHRLVDKVPHGHWNTATFSRLCATTALTRPAC